MFFCGTTTLLFCVSFVFFYHRYAQKQEKSRIVLPAAVNKALPQASLSTIADEPLDNVFFSAWQVGVGFCRPRL
jgi:hypothetical protein